MKGMRRARARGSDGGGEMEIFVLTNISFVQKLEKIFLCFNRRQISDHCNLSTCLCFEDASYFNQSKVVLACQNGVKRILPSSFQLRLHASLISLLRTHEDPGYEGWFWLSIVQ